MRWGGLLGHPKPFAKELQMTDAPTQDELMDKFVEKLLADDGKLIPGILDRVHEQVTKSAEGISKKNDELLSELRAQKKTSDELAAMIKAGGGSQSPKKDIILSREDAMDVKKYRAAKAQAEKAGVQLLIAGRNDGN